jgi:hypothetical protein
MPRVNLPGGPRGGCYGLKMTDGTVYNGKPGQSVMVEEHHAAAISRSGNGQLGIVRASPLTRIRSKTGRRCRSCNFLAYGWAEECPRCGGEVTEENE